MKKIIYSLLAILLLNACSDDAVYPELRNNVIGRVTVLNEFGIRIPDQSGVTVTLEGTDFSGTTNENGVFEIVDVLRGNYRARFQKEGYNDYFADIEVTEGGPASLSLDENNYDFVAPSTVTVTRFEISRSDFTLQIEADLSVTSDLSGTFPDSNPRIAIFVSTSSDVSATNYQDYILSFDTDNDGDIDDFDDFDSNIIRLVDLREEFGDEATIYLVAYAASSFAAVDNSYLDTTTGVNFYYALNGQASQVLTVDLAEEEVTSEPLRQKN
ncbi:MAG: carboxypeptidase-like regulatory domain-containing protein [Thermonemataceae bacterium]